VGDVLPDFFGAGNIRVAGILKPTGTFLDEAHIFSTTNHEKIIFGEDFLVLETPFEEMKYFYIYDAARIPPLLKSVINPKKDTFILDGKTYLSVYIGYKEAQMMIEEKLISRPFDMIPGFFGNDIIVAGLPKKTFTSLDMMHFVPKSFRDNYMKSVGK
jgi:hypothetical protein